MAMTRFFSRGVEVDERTREYIEKRLERIERLVDPVSRFEVEIERTKQGKFRVEVMVKTPRHLYRTEDLSTSIEGSLDIAVDELEVQLSKTKGKSRDLRRRGNRSIKKKLTVSGDARF